jgi:integrase
MIAVPIFTGCRREDIIGLRWQDVIFGDANDDSTWKIQVHKGKNDAARRWISMGRTLRTILLQWKMEAEFSLPDDYVFATSTRGKLSKSSVNRTTTMIRKIAIAGLDPVEDRNSIAILQEFTPHVCRHSWTSAQIARKVDLQTLTDDGGWSNPQVPLTYYAHEFQEARHDGTTGRNMDALYGEETG